MRKESIIFGIAGIFFGMLAGWIIGSQHATGVVAPPAATSAPAAQESRASAAPAFDESRASQLKATADRNPSDANIRVQLGNLYFDAERYDDATRWYEDALRVDPRNVNASTDLGIAYYYSNQPDRALAQFDGRTVGDRGRERGHGAVRAETHERLDRAPPDGRPRIGEAGHERLGRRM